MNLFSSLDLGLSVLSAYVGVKNLDYYLRIRAEKARFHFSLLCFSIALYTAAAACLYASDSASSGMPWQRLQFFCSALIAIEFVNFSYSLLTRRSDWPKKILFGLFAICALSGLFLGRYVLDQQPPMERLVRAFGVSSTYFESKPGIVWDAMMASQFLGMCYLSFLLVAEFIKRKGGDLLPLLLGFLAFFASTVADYLIASNILSSLYTAEYAFVLLLLIMDSLFLKRFVGALREVEALNLSLGEKVKERTLEIQSLADELAAANCELKQRNAVLTELAERDSMTALLNHAAFHRRFSELFNLARRHAIPVCVMLLDIDRFKGINDRFGHQAGDGVIKRFAETLKEGSRNYDLKARYDDTEQSIQPALRNYDIAGRYGGDEFAIALPYCGAPEARIVADRICSMIRELVFDQYPGLRVSASIGCAVLIDASRLGDEKLIIRLADKALYDAKERGRDNAVICRFEENEALEG